ncbi:flavodoxin [bacterium]|nr:flavodoxin [bacterium]
MIRALIVYYSFEGNTSFIARNIAQAIPADIIELKPLGELISQGFMKYLKGGRQVILKMKPELERLNKDPRDYGLLLLGSPVWAWSFTPPLRTFFNQYEIRGKKIAFFICHAGMPGKTIENMKDALPGNQFVGEIDFTDPLKHDKDNAALKAQQWAIKIVSELENDEI